MKIGLRVSIVTCCCFLFFGILLESLAQAPSLEKAFSSPAIFLFSLFNIIFMGYTLGHLYAFSEDREKDL